VLSAWRRTGDGRDIDSVAPTRWAWLLIVGLAACSGLPGADEGEHSEGELRAGPELSGDPALPGGPEHRGDRDMPDAESGRSTGADRASAQVSALEPAMPVPVPSGPLLDAAPAGASLLPTEGEASALARDLLEAASPPEGLSTARRAEREAQRSASLERLRTSLHGPGGALRSDLIGHWLRDGRLDAELWAATAEAVGALDLERFAPDLLWALDEPAPSHRRTSARRALHALFGLWFETDAECADFLAHSVHPARVAYRERLLGLEAEQLDLRRRAWRAPDDVLVDLGDRAPDVRAAAGAALLELLSEMPVPEPESAERWAASVLDRLAAETDPRALESELAVVQLLLRDLPGVSDQVDRARAMFVRGIERAPGRVVPSVARALVALPMPEAAAQSVALSARALLGALERRMRSLDRDADATISVLGSLRRLATSIDGEALAVALPDGALTAAALDIAGASETPSAVRRAALAALSDVASARDLEAVVARLGAALEDEALRFELLGVLERLADRLEPGAPEAATIAAIALEHLDADQYDLRRRTWSLLALPALRAAVGSVEAARMVDALLAEELPELEVAALAALRELAGPPELRALVEDGRTARSAATAGSFAALVVPAARGDATLALRAARRLAEGEGRTAHELALGVVLALDEVSAVADPSDCSAVGAWALEVLEEGAWESGADGARDAERLLVEYVPRAADLSDSERACLRGLLGHAAGRPSPEVEAELGAALLLARDPARRGRLLGLRARVRSEAGDPRGAFADWNVLAFGPEGSGLDGLSEEDLRQALRAGELAAASLPSEAAGRDVARSAIAFGEALIAREGWGLEAVAVRWSEVEQLAGVVLQAADRPAAARLLERLTPGGSGVLTDLVGRAELSERAAALRSRLESLAGASEPSPVPVPPAESAGG
jgi:hypothetical protein